MALVSECYDVLVVNTDISFRLEPGPLQARALIEASLSTSETLKENNVQIVTGKIHLLSPHFDRNSPGMKVLSL